MAYITNRLVSINLYKIKCDDWHRLTCGVCTGGRYVITGKFSPIHRFPISRSARGGSTNNNDDSDNDNHGDNERDFWSSAIAVWSTIKHKQRRWTCELSPFYKRDVSYLLFNIHFQKWSQVTVEDNDETIYRYMNKNLKGACKWD